MAEIKIFDQNAKESGKKSVDDAITAVEVNPVLVKSVIQTYLNNQKKHTANTKTRNAVAGSGEKPWRQKGTGRARSGSAKSPIWRGGGTVFGPHPRDTHKTVTRKMRKTALKQALAGKLQSEEVILFDNLTLESPNTKTISEFLKNVGILGSPILFVTGNENTFKSARNIARVDVKACEYINTYDLVRYKYMVMSQDDFDSLVEKVSS